MRHTALSGPPYNLSAPPRSKVQYLRMDVTRGRRRTVDEAEADRAVTAALRARGGVATRADIVVATGLPEMAVERSLERLLDRYDSSVGVREGGVLVYRFRRFRPRPERRRLLGAFIRGVASAARGVVRAGRVTFRALLAVQLLLYAIAALLPITIVVGVVVGIGILILGIFAALSEGGDASILQILFEPVLLAIVLGVCILAGIVWTFKKKYALLLALVGRDRDGQGGIAGFIKQVNDFATGPLRPHRRDEWVDRTRRISLGDEKIVLARIRAREAKLRAGDLVDWLGIDLDEADRQATRIAVEYGGDPTAADVEVVEFTFPSLLPSAAADGDAAATLEAALSETRHERGPASLVLTGNTRGEDGFISVLALLNLVAGGIGWYYLAPWRDTTDAPVALRELAYFAGAVIPIGFSLLLSGLFALRVPVYLVRRALARRRAAAASVHDTVVDHCLERGDVALDLDALDAARPLTRRVAVGLGGAFEVTTDDAGAPGKTVWRFRRLAAELAPRRRTPAPASERPPTASTTRRRKGRASAGRRS